MAVNLQGLYHKGNILKQRRGKEERYTGKAIRLMFNLSTTLMERRQLKSVLKVLREITANLESCNQ